MKTVSFHPVTSHRVAGSKLCLIEIKKKDYRNIWLMFPDSVPTPAGLKEMAHHHLTRMRRTPMSFFGISRRSWMNSQREEQSAENHFSPRKEQAKLKTLLRARDERKIMEQQQWEDSCAAKMKS